MNNTTPHSHAGSDIDHLVVMAATLEDGVRWAEDVLGITLGPGGAHPLMGTHNRLINISGPGFAACYLEVIAVDPAATPQRAPHLKRWFDMDNAAVRAAVAANGPQLVSYVARSRDIAAAAQALAQQGLDCGSVVATSRQTAKALLRWRISLRDDGQRLMSGALPTLIQWGTEDGQETAHPTDDMPASGVQLQALQLTHPQTEPLKRACEALGLRSVQIARGPAGICAVLQTPRGLVRLMTPAAEGKMDSL